MVQVPSLDVRRAEGGTAAHRTSSCGERRSVSPSGAPRGRLSCQSLVPQDGRTLRRRSSYTSHGRGSRVSSATQHSPSGRSPVIRPLRPWSAQFRSPSPQTAAFKPTRVRTPRGSKGPPSPRMETRGAAPPKVTKVKRVGGTAAQSAFTSPPPPPAVVPAPPVQQQQDAAPLRSDSPPPLRPALSSSLRSPSARSPSPPFSRSPRRAVRWDPTPKVHLLERTEYDRQQNEILCCGLSHDPDCPAARSSLSGYNVCPACGGERVSQVEQICVQREGGSLGIVCDDRMLISGVRAGSPAAVAGLQAGMRIVSVGAEITQSLMDFDKIVAVSPKRLCVGVVREQLVDEELQSSSPSPSEGSSSPPSKTRRPAPSTRRPRGSPPLRFGSSPRTG